MKRFFIYYDRQMLCLSDQLIPLWLESLADLAMLAGKVDEGLPEIYYGLLKNKRAPKSNALFFEKERLLGIASVFFFEATCAEITLLVAPEIRRQGIAKSLLRALLPTIHENHVQKLRFSSGVAPFSTQAPFFAEKNLSYEESEFHMAFTPTIFQILEKFPWRFRIGTLDDIPELIGLDMLCFPGTDKNSGAHHLRHMLSSSEYTIWVVETANGECIAKGHIRWEEKKAILTDIAVHPDMQKQGVGRTLLKHLLNEIYQKQKTATLAVTSESTRALHLYQKQGFELQKTVYYWGIGIEKLEKYLID